MIPNPEYKGEWKPRQIDNPNYQGEWEHPKIPNPEYAEDSNLYMYKDFGNIGFDLWQVWWWERARWGRARGVEGVRERRREGREGDQEGRGNK